MEELQTFLNEVYEKGQLDILANILKIPYNFCGLLIPDIVQLIFNCDAEELTFSAFFIRSFVMSLLPIFNII